MNPLYFCKAGSGVLLWVALRKEMMGLHGMARWSLGHRSVRVSVLCAALHCKCDMQQLLKF